MEELIISLVFNAVFIAVALIYFFTVKPRWIDKLEEKIPEYMAGVGSSLMASAKGTIMGIASGESRGKKALMKAATSDLIEQSNPILATVLKQFPSVGELIADNPNLLPIALNMLGKMNLGNSNGGGGEIGSYADGLNKYK